MDARLHSRERKDLAAKERLDRVICDSLQEGRVFFLNLAVVVVAVP